MVRYIFITGGVASSLGKGVAAASLGALLQARGYRVRLRKLDPYLNVDPGTMSPYQHGEVFVTDDGAETDLDLGHYERFTDVSACRSDNVTTGRIYQTILEQERRGDYLGATIQVIPHVTDEIKKFIVAHTEGVDFMLCEIGGTVGDIEGQPYLEAIRQLAQELEPQRCVFVHLTFLPFIVKAGEMKTKPTQHSVKELRSIGIQPHILLCRCERPIGDSERRKLALFCNVRPESVVEAPDLDHVYDAPLDYHEHGLDGEVLRHAAMEDAPLPDMARWREVAERQHEPDGCVRIALVGKYTSLPDAYKSVMEALDHGGLANRARVDLRWVDAGDMDAASVQDVLAEVDGVLLPGGFGRRGVEGKILAARYAREQKIPFFAICFGMQLAVIEVARNLAGLSGAGSREFSNPEIALVGLLEEWDQGGKLQTRSADGDKGGTMRLGAYPAVLQEGSRIAEIYGAQLVSERHRHRYEVNPVYKEQLGDVGLRFSGFSPDGKLPETVELDGHPWYIGVQFHPELKSRPFDPHPLFASFIDAALTRSRLV